MKRPHAWCLLAGALTLWTSCSPPDGDNGGQDESSAEGQGSPWFVESAAEAGLDFVHSLGNEIRFWIPETVCGGLALFDFDADGDLDLYCVQSGGLTDNGLPEGRQRNRLYENDGTGRFQDVTEASGTGHAGYGIGCTTGDFDGDGYVDLYVTNLGPNVLYRNRGDGTFEDASEASGTDEPGFGASCAFVDHDGDGDLDLFVANYLRWSAADEPGCKTEYGTPMYCAPARYDAPARDCLFENRGNGTFRDVSVARGLGAAFGNGLGVAWAELDGQDGIELYVANDGMANQLWKRDGAGLFKDRALALGCAVNGNGAAEAGMGLLATDLTGDGQIDLFSTHVYQETHTLYEGRNGRFVDATGRARIAGPTGPKTGFGVGGHDFDHDGYLDLFIACGRVRDVKPVEDPERPLAETDQLLAGGPDGRFSEIPMAGLSAPLATLGRAAAFGDIDGDGDVDAVVLDAGAPLRLYRNEAGSGGGGHWAQFQVLDTGGGVALGAVVRARVGERWIRRDVQVAYSYCAANDPTVHFGLGTAERIDELEISWPDGTRTQAGPFSSGSRHVIARDQ